jgi:predicted phage-related endonuclease
MADHRTAMSGSIPEKYIPQCDYLLAVSGAEVCHYFSYREGESELIEHYPDAQRIKQSLDKARRFWNCVVQNQPPEIGRRI